MEAVRKVVVEHRHQFVGFPGDLRPGIVEHLVQERAGDAVVPDHCEGELFALEGEFDRPVRFVGSSQSRV
ncbi:hypothetical protein HMPREF2863_06925 [Micrococcus sp. HMSC067E09]|nr:hypothetical protein HMPREF2863_06925 [Micrococcus sp. HMSC067E09]